MQKQTARIKYQNNSFKPAYGQNSNIQGYFHIFMTQKSLKSGWTIQGNSVSESLSMEWNRLLRGLTIFVFNFGVESLEQSWVGS